MKTGLCSITFRQLSVQQIVDLVKQADLDAIEWGGDVHVPPGDIVAAEEAKRLTLEAGLEVSSYGSYYFVLDKDGQKQDFAPVLESALALGTNTIRIWPGSQPSEVASEKYRTQFVEKLRADLDAAAAKNVRLALEFHGNSFSDSNAAALALLDEVNHPNLYTYWQPMYWIADADYRFQGLEKLADRVINLHVFQWLFHPMRGGWGDNIERLPLSDGEAEWRKYLSVDLPPGDHCALMEFVRGDDLEQFKQDAAALRRFLN
jgi:sugar phosphate isomerase/epimerase